MINSRVLFPEITNPFLNQALEGLFLNSVFNREYDLIVRFWISEPAVIIGRNQSLKAEVNKNACQKYKIPIIRRITGGGAVYLDIGCLNFSFYLNNNCTFYTKHVSNLTKFLIQIIINALKKSNFDCLYQLPNSIMINGKKISGNAQIFKGNSVLHHGTLLLNSDLQKQREVLNKNNTSNVKRYISSKKIDTINLSFINKNITPEKIIQNIVIHAEKAFQLKFSKINLTETELNQAMTIMREKNTDSNWLNRIP